MSIPTWRLTCHVADCDRPGILARVTACIAERGVSLGEVLAQRTAEGPRITLTITAAEPLRDWLIRRLLRDPAITTVDVVLE